MIERRHRVETQPQTCSPIARQNAEFYDDANEIIQGRGYRSNRKRELTEIEEEKQRLGKTVRRCDVARKSWIDYYKTVMGNSMNSFKLPKARKDIEVMDDAN